MMKILIKKLMVFCFIFMMFIGFLFCDDDSNGRTNFQFLKMDVTARSLALGGAFGAVSDDVSSIRYNPAGLRMLVRPQISATHMEWIEDFRIEYFAYGKPVGINQAVGYSLLYLSLAEDVIGRDDDGYATSNLKYEQSAVAFSWAKRLDRYDNYLLGTNIKYAREVLDYSQKSVIAADIGFLARMYKNVLFGATVRNIAFGNENLPLETRLAFSVLKRKIGWSFDAYKFSDTGMRYAFGAEYFMKEFFVLRAGYNTSLSSLGDLLEYEQMSEFSEYSIAGMSLGFGILTKPVAFLGGNEVKFDYAMVDYGKFGFTHIFTLSMDL